MGKKIGGLQSWSIPGLSGIRWIGPVLFKGDVLVFGIVPAALFIWWVLYRTRWGLNLRTTGESRTAAASCPSVERPGRFIRHRNALIPARVAPVRHH